MLARFEPRQLLVPATIAAATIAAVVYLAASGKDPGGVAGADAGDAALVARGATVYASQCASCHGANLEGQPDWRQRQPDGKLPAPPHDASGHTWHHDDRTLFDITKYGVAALVGQPVPTDMPVYDGVLPDADIWAVLAYIKSRWPEPIRERQAQLNARAATPAGS
jgi:mono/diheme cytochrome c family protein